MNIDIRLANCGRLRDVERHLQRRGPLLDRSVVMLAGAIDDVPRKRPMDVPAVVVVARLMEMLDVPGECVLRVASRGYGSKGPDPAQRQPPTRRRPATRAEGVSDSSKSGLESRLVHVAANGTERKEIVLCINCSTLAYVVPV
jgi:hypothetical protein